MAVSLVEAIDSDASVALLPEEARGASGAIFVGVAARAAPMRATASSASPASDASVADRDAAVAEAEAEEAGVEEAGVDAAGVDETALASPTGVVRDAFVGNAACATAEAAACAAPSSDASSDAPVVARSAAAAGAADSCATAGVRAGVASDGVALDCAAAPCATVAPDVRSPEIGRENVWPRAENALATTVRVSGVLSGDAAGAALASFATLAPAAAPAAAPSDAVTVAGAARATIGAAVTRGAGGDCVGATAAGADVAAGKRSPASVAPCASETFFSVDEFLCAETATAASSAAGSLSPAPTEARAAINARGGSCDGATPADAVAKSAVAVVESAVAGAAASAGS